MRGRRALCSAAPRRAAMVACQTQKTKDGGGGGHGKARRGTSRPSVRRVINELSPRDTFVGSFLH